MENGQWVYTLSIHNDKPCEWRDDEIELLQEVTTRIWARLEKARAEETLRASEAQLKDLIKIRDEFIGVARHELKTSVTSMRAYGEIVLDKLERAGSNAEATLIVKMNAQLDRLTNLINQLLDTTGISGRLKLNIERFDLADLLEERVEEISQTNTHKFVMQIEALDLQYADRERIGQVVTNLLSNYMKYSPAKTTITVSPKQSAREILVSITDEGYGISAEDQQKIFDRFFRVTTNNMDTFPGMGLGLYITAQIVHRHAGKISVQSESGRGSTFTFTLPLKQP